MSQSKEGKSTRGNATLLCDYFGISRQGYYAHIDRADEVDILTSSVAVYCQTIRQSLPKAGMRELYDLSKRHFGEKFNIGRDKCYAILRTNGLVQRNRYRPRTTNSNHNYYIYPDLLNVPQKLVAHDLGKLVVADITYVATNNGWAYLSLLTDAATRLIVGWSLQKTLSTDGPMEALQMALNFYKNNGVDLTELIHHSDRGVQYCSNNYVNLLKENNIRISMTQTGDPLHNALAERMNNTIKNGWLIGSENETFKAVRQSIQHGISMYNMVRPHQSLSMKTPAEVSEVNPKELIEQLSLRPIEAYEDFDIHHST